MWRYPKFLLGPLTRNTPCLASFLRVARGLGPALRKHTAADTSRRDYENAGADMSAAPPPVTDMASAFFLRVLLEGNYETAIEIGASTGARITTLKRLLGPVNAYGLDIMKNYQTPFEMEGVCFEKFDPCFFASPRPASLVVSRGTLCCFTPDELVAFLTVLRKGSYDLAFYEPMGYFPAESAISRSRESFYHPYPELLQDAGFRLANDDWNRSVAFSFNVSMMESWFPGYAVCPKS
ncbi:MAG TPA: hypothetical protein DCP05_03400 [Rhodospirillaceae bacterium]|nr:hypothetical protein [Rhodospirillaceae bacterium]MDP6485703.1 hypothetical protein [Alphaproteobacteria bacterium]MDP6660030.1 hypothetical protein [Alphaproteobacteria bacterium]MDP6781274.1 hypothetical protein [Alphaproteobacteria bacterium]HAQ33131.1 hypothetical protein [Rhodospirillaceae bacterium]